jgi:hypothetical protein
MPVQRRVGRLQRRGQGLDLIPQGLLGDGQPFAPHDPGLPLQR